MIQTIISAIQQELTGTLTIEQMQMLIHTLNKHLAGLEAGGAKDASDNRPALLPMFISAKRVEGCSEKSLRYYESTIRNMLEAIDKLELPGCLPAARYGQQGDAGQYPQGAFLLLLLAGR